MIKHVSKKKATFESGQWLYLTVVLMHNKPAMDVVLRACWEAVMLYSANIMHQVITDRKAKS
jgi:hypothetical protein